MVVGSTLHNDAQLPPASTDLTRTAHAGGSPGGNIARALVLRKVLMASYGADQVCGSAACRHRESAAPSISAAVTAAVNLHFRRNVPVNQITDFLRARSGRQNPPASDHSRAVFSFKGKRNRELAGAAISSRRSIGMTPQI